MRSKPLWIATSLVPVALAAIAGAPSPTPINLPKALAVQQERVLSNPADAAAQVDLGNLLLLDGKTAEAEAAYRRAITLDPASVNAHFDLGLLLQQRKEERAASQEFKRVIELAPDHAWAHYQLGVLREGSGNESAAVRSYATAFALNPRLAFPDVNPHVLENKLVTPAMLRAYRSELPPLQPGAAYEEPVRIVGILVGEPAQGAQAAQEAGVATPGMPTPTPRPDAIAEPSAAGEPRTLRPGDLSRVGDSGQATPGASSVVRRGARPVIVDEEGNEQPDVEIYEPPVPTLRIPTPTDPGTGVVPTPYQPGVPSTGRLEMHLRDTWGREIGRG